MVGGVLEAAGAVPTADTLIDAAPVDYVILVLYFGVLMGAYGIILLLMGLFADPETDKTGGINANLWAGIGLTIVGVVFVTWSRLRPVKVPEHVEPVGDDETRPAPRKKQRTD